MFLIFAVFLCLFACLLKEGHADCNAMRCGHYSNCEYINGTAMCVCDLKCATWLAPICGTDGVTYGNECLMNTQSCLSKQNIQVQHIGICSSEDRYCSSLPSPPKNSKFIKVHNSTYYIHCLHGYYRKGDARVKCRNGKWEIFAACYKKACSHPDALDNGKVDYELSNFGSKVYYECDECFDLDGPKERVCLGNETWSGTTPVCKPINCGHMLENWELPNGMVFGHDTFCGSAIEFECLEGYELIGSHSVTCQTNGRWSEEKPVCRLRADSSTQEVPVPLKRQPLRYCIPLDSPKNGQIQSVILDEFYLPGQKIIFGCKDKYVLTGESTLTCMKNGNWSHPAPSCNKTEPINGAASTQCSYCNNQQYICNKIDSSDFTIIGKLIDEDNSSYTLRVKQVVKDTKGFVTANKWAKIWKIHSFSKCVCTAKGIKGSIVFTGFYSITPSNDVRMFSRDDGFIGKFYGTKQIKFCF